jgi:hypothetical protein
MGNWAGEIQVDASGSVLGDRLLVRDAWLRYLGFAEQGLTITMGNQKTPFARSALASTTRRGLIERPATGERPFGAPGRTMSVQIEGRHDGERLQWAAAIGSALHAPDVLEIRIDGIADARDTWNDGLMGAGRIEWHPRGAVPRDQGDFTRSAFRVVTAASMYVWHNDGDRNLFTTDGTATSTLFADADRARGLEISTGLRGHGFSLDAAWQRISAHTVDPRFTGGIYRSGSALFYSTSIEAGYMVLPGKLEILGGFDTVDIEARPSLAYRPAFGVSWYVYQHRLKFQFSHRESFNVLGATDARGRSTTVQAQVAF